MKASISILKSQLSRYLDAVKSGEEVIVTERGRPIARLTSLDREYEATGRTARLVREGRIRAPVTRPRDNTSHEIEVRDPEGLTLTYLLAERDEGP